MVAEVNAATVGGPGEPGALRPYSAYNLEVDLHRARGWHREPGALGLPVGPGTTWGSWGCLSPLGSRTT